MISQGTRLIIKRLRARLRRSIRYLLAASFALLLIAPVYADGTQPDDLLNAARFEQRLNTQVSLDLAFRDETGRSVLLGDYLRAKPLVLVPAYYNCPNLCGVVIQDLIVRLKALSFDVGKQFDVAIVSIDPRETPTVAAAKKREYLTQYARAGSAGGWHNLTGDQPAIEQLARETGFQYAYDAQLGQYSHPSGLILLTPQGKISKYFYGLEYTSTDLRLGLIEASASRIGSPIDQVLLRCYHYDPVTGKYTVAIEQIIQVVGSGTALALGAFLWFAFRRERRGAPGVEQGRLSAEGGGWSGDD